MRIQLSLFIIEIFSISMEDYVPFVGSDGEKLTISSYIECLQQALETFGDLPVVVDSADDFDDYLYCPTHGGAWIVFAQFRGQQYTGTGAYAAIEDEDYEDGEFVIHLDNNGRY